MKLRRWSAKDIKSGTRVFLRIDANVPIKNGKAQDGGVFGRISQALPEIERLRKRGASIILASHLGDPGGKVDKKFSLAPVARVFERRLKRSVPLVTDLKVPELRPGELCLLENLRFDAGEEKNSDSYAWKLAKLADVYVNNAFGVCHRRHASVHAITRHLPSFAGELLEREVAELSQAPTKPFVLVMGGAKIETKLGILHQLGPKADRILLGGGLSVTFLAAAEVDLPAYPAELMKERDMAMARKVLRQFGRKMILPIDLIAKPKQHLVIDIGPETRDAFAHELAAAETIIWNGPLGIIERPDGMAGTLSVAKAMTKSGARVVTGGGETVEFLEDHKLLKGFAHVSTGGGAMLAFLSGEHLPGLEALRA
jgi:3-phosphoglycerate kinase